MTHECKIISKEQMDEMQTLWNDGHADAITAFGLECVEAYKEGESKGTKIGIALGVVAGIAGIVTSLIVRKKKKHTQKYVVAKMKRK